MEVWQIVSAVIVILILIIAYLWNLTGKLKEEIKIGCSNYSDPDLTNTREIIIEKMKNDIRKKLTIHIKKQYKSILKAEGKLREYKENKVVKNTVESLDDAIESEIMDGF